MSEPDHHDKPEDAPGGRPTTPPGQGGEQPGNRPDVPPGQEDKPDKPGEGEAGEPTHPIVDPEDAPQPTPQAVAVEALMGLRDFLTLAPRRRSEASTQAAQAAFKRWMTLRGHSTDGFYTPAEWQGYYQEMLASH